MFVKQSVYFYHSCGENVKQMQSLANFCSMKMHICILDITAVFEFTHMGWVRHQSELGGNSGTLLCWWVGSVEGSL